VVKGVFEGGGNIQHVASRAVQHALWFSYQNKKKIKPNLFFLISLSTVCIIFVRVFTSHL
jgi:hypothetical protein